MIKKKVHRTAMRGEGGTRYAPSLSAQQKLSAHRRHLLRVDASFPHIVCLRLLSMCIHLFLSTLPVCLTRVHIFSLFVFVVVGISLWTHTDRKYEKASCRVGEGMRRGKERETEGERKRREQHAGA
jgi:hypothetical protein